MCDMTFPHYTDTELNDTYTSKLEKISKDGGDTDVIDGCKTDPDLDYLGKAFIDCI